MPGDAGLGQVLDQRSALVVPARGRLDGRCLLSGDGKAVECGVDERRVGAGVADGALRR